MPKINMTASVVSALKPCDQGKAKIYFDSQTSGLSLVLSSKGRKTWTARFRFEDKQQRLTLGKYPDVSLKRARDLMSAIRVQLADGVNPAEEKRKAKSERREAIISKSIRAVGKSYLYAASKGRHKPNAKRPLSENSIKTHSYAAAYIDRLIGDVLITELKRSDIEDIIIELEEEYNKGRAVIARDYLSGLFSFAVHRGLIEHNPVLNIYKPSYQSRDRVADDGELRELFECIRDEQVGQSSPSTRLALELCAVTATRAGEVAGIMLDELDLEEKLWTIPSHRTKNKREHIVPLSDHAVELIREALSHHKFLEATQEVALFHTPIRGDTPITAHALSRAFRRVTAKSNLEDLHLHDLRRTAATGMAQLGIRNELIAKVLNHTDHAAPQVTGVYNRYGYVDEKRKALDAWSNRFVEITDKTEWADISNIVPIQKK